MCFRPPGVEQSVNCPECDKKINAVMGNIPPECPFCGADIAAYAAEQMAEEGGSAAAAPGTPPKFNVKPGAPGASSKAPTFNVKPGAPPAMRPKD